MVPRREYPVPISRALGEGGIQDLGTEPYFVIECFLDKFYVPLYGTMVLYREAKQSSQAQE